ncbi:MAG: glycosyltransferase [Patescibacteria group bacterium]
MKKILIVSLKAGAGHLKAAQAIEKAIKLQCSDLEVKNIDLLDYASILSKEFYGNWYLDIANKVPEFYAWLYNKLDSSSTRVRLLSDRMNTQKFQKFVGDYNPDLVICTHFVPANLLTFWRKQYQLKFKIVLTLTDYEAHKLWVDNQVDMYTVATEYVEEQFVEFGADKNKIKVTGIPIDIKFLSKIEKEEVRKKLGLENKFTISIFAGAFGVGSLQEIFAKITKIENDFQIIAIAGKNKQLYKEFQNLAQKSTKKIMIRGFADNMEEIMAASDVAVSKAGGLTVSECLATNLPLIITHPFPGQEEANTRYLLNNQAAFVADKPGEVINIFEKVLKNPVTLKQMKQNIEKISKPNAALDIVKLIKKFIEP